MDLAVRPDQRAGLVGQQRRVEVAAPGLLAEADVDGDALLPGAAQHRLQRLGRHLVLEELIVVVADALGEVRRQRHLRVGDQVDLLGDRLLEEHEHPIDDLVPTGALVDRPHLGRRDFHLARHGVLLRSPYVTTATDVRSRHREAR